MAEITRIIRATLLDDPSVYREIEIGGQLSLAELAEAVVDAFDFDMDHAYGFYSGTTDSTLLTEDPRYELFADMDSDDTDALSVEETAVDTAFPDIGSKMTFLFDYGDEWLFEMEVVGVGEAGAEGAGPRVVGAEGEAPDQYPDLDDEDWDDDDDGDDDDEEDD